MNSYRKHFASKRFRSNSIRIMGVALVGGFLGASQAVAGVNVCAPPTCPVPVLELPIAAQAHIQIILMLVSFAAAWLMVSGAAMVVGFFPRKRTPALLLASKTATDQWQAAQELMQEENKRWNTDPELIHARKIVGSRMLIVGILLATCAVMWESHATVNPTGVSAEVTESDGRTWPVEFLADGKALVAGKTARWTSLRDRIILSEGATSTCWLWDSGTNGLWRFNPNCPSVGTHPMPTANMRIIKVPTPRQNRRNIRMNPFEA